MGTTMTMLILHKAYCCDYCQQLGTTMDGGLWRWSATDDAKALYYLHGRCLAAYKSDKGLRSVEGRVPFLVRDTYVA